MLSFNRWHPIHFSLMDQMGISKKNNNSVARASLRFWHPLEGIHMITWAISAIVMSLAIFWIISGETIDAYPDKRTLDVDGYVVIRDASKQKALQYLPKNYEFLQYTYVIRGCSLSTFHRDVTSSPYIYDTIHPVYTYIEYTTPTETPLLSICPGSHRTTPFLYSSPVVIVGKGITGILFHCDAVHAGAINTLGNERYVTQYKIAHIDDMKTLSHLHNIQTIKTGMCNISPFYEHITRRISWIFSHIANHHFTSYLQTRPDTHIGKMLVSLYGRDFYNK
jgi:hypothetical protein